MSVFLFFAFIGLLASACSSPAAPSGASCQSDNTAAVSLQNGSQNMFSYDVFVDSGNRGTVAFNQTIGPFHLTAGVNHTIEARVTNSSQTACSSTLSLAQCAIQTLQCNGP